jgi:hypothetical protein
MSKKRGKKPARLRAVVTPIASRPRAYGEAPAVILSEEARAAIARDTGGKCSCGAPAVVVETREGGMLVASCEACFRAHEGKETSRARRLAASREAVKRATEARYGKTKPKVRRRLPRPPIELGARWRAWIASLENLAHEAVATAFDLVRADDPNASELGDDGDAG